VNLLLTIIGSLALGFCVPLYRAITGKDQAFATSLAWYHIINGIVLFFAARTGGTAFKMLLPFILHDFASGGLLFASLPNSSPLWPMLSKLHLA
jgi:hypothetical protein